MAICKPMPWPLNTLAKIAVKSNRSTTQFANGKRPGVQKWIAGCLLVGLTALAGVWGFLNVGVWISAEGKFQHVDAIVCLAGPDRFKTGAELVRAGWADYLIASLGNQRFEIADSDIPTDRLRVVAGARSTYEEAVKIFPVLEQLDVRSAIIVSDPYHLYRARWAFEHVAGNSDIRFVAVGTVSPFHADGWWKERRDRLVVESEVCKTLFYWFYHGLLGATEEPEWALEMRKLL